MDTQLTQSDANLHLVLTAIDNDPKLKDSTKHQYRKAVLAYVETGNSLTDPHALTAYAQTVGSSTRAFLKAAVGKLCAQIEQEAMSNATPGNVETVQATIYRAKALRNAVEVEKSSGQKVHTWLSAAEVKRLLATCDTSTLDGLRDRVCLALLVGAGLRRAEAAALTFEDVFLKPVKERLRTTLRVIGKGDKTREVPVSDALANLLDQWSAMIGNQGRILRALGRDRVPSASISAVAILDIVRKHGALIGKLDLAPHDLRRTFAQLGYEAGVPIVQISRLLGHASVETTQRYLNLELDLETTVSDFVPV